MATLTELNLKTFMLLWFFRYLLHTLDSLAIVEIWVISTAPQVANFLCSGCMALFLTNPGKHRYKWKIFKNSRVIKIQIESWLCFDLMDSESQTWKHFKRTTVVLVSFPLVGYQLWKVPSGCSTCLCFWSLRYSWFMLWTETSDLSWCTAPMAGTEPPR